MSATGMSRACTTTEEKFLNFLKFFTHLSNMSYNSEQACFIDRIQSRAYYQAKLAGARFISIAWAGIKLSKKLGGRGGKQLEEMPN